MCGICGIIGKKNDKEEILKRMMRVMKHRGPDSEGIYCTDDAAFGFCRLSIIDLEDGSQPMKNETEDMALVFNGEIYNYQSLRKKLMSKDHIFRNHSDSEVLIHGYEEFGEVLLDKLRGMFAFAIWDETKKCLFAARDYFGIKPFYYAMIDGCFVFASEIKCILEFPGFKREVNAEALEQYLSFQYSALSETFFKGIYKLMPGHYLNYENQRIVTKQYFDPMLQPERGKSDEEWIEQLDKTIQNTVKQHMVSDVEVGTFLSGGVDSSLIAATFTGKKAFTVGFMDEDSKYNETRDAKRLAKHLQLDHYCKNISEEEYWEAVPKVMYHLDEPSGDAAAVALYFVAREASNHVKVVTSGEGADELFGGYNIYLEPGVLCWFSWIPKWIRKRIGALACKLPEGMKGRGYLIRGSKSVEERFIGNANIFSAKERKEILKQETGAVTPQELLKNHYRKAANLSNMNKMQYIDLTWWLPGDILQKADRMSMAHSLELRVPFLDKEVFKVARKLPLKAKIRHHKTKYLFRAASLRYLPQLSSKKKKLGFPVPIREWIKEESGYRQVEERFTSEAAAAWFYTDKLMKLLDQHRQGTGDYSRKIWTVYAFLVWHQIFLEA